MSVLVVLSFVLSVFVFVFSLSCVVCLHVASMFHVDGHRACFVVVAVTLVCDYVHALNCVSMYFRVCRQRGKTKKRKSMDKTEEKVNRSKRETWATRAKLKKESHKEQHWTAKYLV